MDDVGEQPNSDVESSDQYSDVDEEEVTAEHVAVEMHNPACGKGDTVNDIAEEAADFVENVVHSQQQQGYGVPPMALAFRDVFVYKSFAVDPYLQTVRSAFSDMLPWTKSKRPVQRAALKGICGYVKPGEMLLILGPPGSGCSSLMKALALRHDDFDAVGGEILYNGVDFRDWKPENPMTFVADEDIHIPQLSVRQTLEYALNSVTPPEWPGSKETLEAKLNMILKVLGLSHVQHTSVGSDLVRGLSGGERKRLTIAEMVTSMCPMIFMDGYSVGLDSAASIDIARTIRTVTKRTGFSCVMTLFQVPPAIFNLVDNVLVLDAGRQVYFGPPSGALDYCKDVVGVEAPEFRTVPDHLCRLGVEFSESTQRKTCNECGRPRDLAKIFKTSEEHKRLDEVLEEGVLPSDPQLVLSSEAKSALTRRYPTPLWDQIRHTVKREWQVLSRTRSIVIQRIMRLAILGLLLGTAFWDLENDASGAYSRGGLIFTALINVGLASFAFIPHMLEKRAVYYKQNGAGFLRPVAYILSLVITDLPVTVAESVMFGTVIFWFTGMNDSSIDRYFFFLLCVIGINITLASYIRLVSAAAPDLPAAQAYGTSTIILMVLFSGYTIPEQSIPSYWKWYYYLNPIHYAFQAVANNEFLGLELTCATGDLIPTAAQLAAQGIPVGNYSEFQVCPIRGSTGSATVPGSDFARAQFGVEIDSGRRWVDYGVFVAFAVVYVVMSVVVLGVHHRNVNSKGLRYKKRTSTQGLQSILRKQSERRNLPYSRTKRKTVTPGTDFATSEEAQNRQESLNTVKNTSTAVATKNGEFTGGNSGNGNGSGASNSGKKSGIAGAAISHTQFRDVEKGGEIGENEKEGAYMVWRNISYSVDVEPPKAEKKSGSNSQDGEASSTRKALLKNVTGYIKPGQLVALMGSSGAGKTTLLDVLARRKTGGQISGDIWINNELQDNRFRRVAGYVEQFDALPSRSTVREAIKFSASLRGNFSGVDGEREREIEREVREALDVLGLGSIADAMIGGEDTSGGISTEARKRVSIAIELVAKPAILFLDEPTSGLDTVGAQNVIRSIRNVMEKRGTAVLCTIHQPSGEIFSQFDALLLLRRGGETVYFGDLGSNSSTLISYFQSRGSCACLAHQNPAEWMLEVIGAGIGHQDVKDWAEVWRGTPNFETLNSLTGDKRVPDLVPEDAPAILSNVVAAEGARDITVSASLRTSLPLILARQLRHYWRTPSYNLTRMVIAVLTAFILGTAYWRLGKSQGDLNDMVGAIFFAVVMGVVHMSSAMAPVFSDRNQLVRELANGYYPHSAYTAAMYFVEIPFAFCAGVLFSALFYFMVGLPLDAGHFFYFVLLYCSYVFFSISFGQAVAAVAPNLVVAQSVAPAFLGVFFIFCGFMIRKPDIPDWYIWLYWLNPNTYFLDGLVSTALHGQTYGCATNEFVPITDRSGSTGFVLDCAQLNVGGGDNFIQSPTDPDVCLYCPFTSGDQFLGLYEMSWDHRWRNYAALIAFTFVSRLVTWLAIRYRRYATR